MAKMEVKTSLLDNMIGVGDMVLLEPLSEESFISNLKQRFDHNEIYERNEICLLIHISSEEPEFACHVIM